MSQTRKIVATIFILFIISMVCAQATFAGSSITLKSGMQNSSVLKLQKDLKKLGFMTVNATGYFGTVTKSAVIKFQKHYGIKSVGIAGSQTLNKIASLLSKSSSVGTHSTTTNSSTNNSGTLKSGMQSSLVTKLQRDLKTLKFMTADATGYFGIVTKSAVIAFQKHFNLTPDGVAGSKTLSKIATLIKAGTISRGDIDRSGTTIVTPTITITDIKAIKQWIPGLPQTTYRKGIGMYEGVVFHYTDNPNDNAQIEANYEKYNWDIAYVHEFIDYRQCIQVANPNYKAWGAGKYANDRFIHIELCSSSNKAEFNASFNMITERIAEYLYARKLGVSPAKSDGTGTLWSHADVSKYLGATDHTDPIAYLAKWGETWQDVINIVTIRYNAIAKGVIYSTPTPTQLPSSTPTETPTSTPTPVATTTPIATPASTPTPEPASTTIPVPVAMLTPEPEM